MGKEGERQSYRQDVLVLVLDPIGQFSMKLV